MDLDGSSLKLFQVPNPLSDRESLFSTTSAHFYSSCPFRREGVFDRFLKLMEEMRGRSSLDRVPPAGLFKVSIGVHEEKTI